MLSKNIFFFLRINMNPYRTHILIYYRQRDGDDDVTTARHITIISLTVFPLRQHNGAAVPTGVTVFCVHSATVHGLCLGCPKHELFNTHLMCCSNRPVKCSAGAVPHSPAEQNAVMEFSVCLIRFSHDSPTHITQCAGTKCACSIANVQ